MPTRIEKLQAHSSLLLDSFIQLQERYALLEPMLFNVSVVKNKGSGKPARGFLILRHSLFLSCSQDIAKLTLDSDERTPSLFKLMRDLSDKSVRDKLRELFAIWEIPIFEDDLEIQEALHRIELREEAERREQFDTLFCEATTIWTKISTSSAMHGFKTIRDKISAHTEIRFVADKYQFVDIGKLGIQWGEIGSTIHDMQKLIELTGLLIRNSNFAWDMLKDQLSQASQDFWGTEK